MRRIFVLILGLLLLAGCGARDTGGLTQEQIDEYQAAAMQYGDQAPMKDYGVTVTDAKLEEKSKQQNGVHEYNFLIEMTGTSALTLAEKVKLLQGMKDAMQPAEDGIVFRLAWVGDGVLMRFSNVATLYSYEEDGHTYISDEHWEDMVAVAEEVQKTLPSPTAKPSPAATSPGTIHTPKPTAKTPSYTLESGTVLEVTVFEGTLIIKAKIEPSLTNKFTIDQNYYNVCDIIQHQGGDRFTRISYWAVADMADGSEGKVISFDVPERLIQAIAANDDYPANTMGEKVEDLWILPSLQS